jgi:hypothetical protein
MKRTLFALYLLLASGGPLFAGDSATDGLTFTCTGLRLPTLAATSAVSGIDNAGAAYAERERLMHQAERLCKAPGVAQVRFVPESQVAVEPLRTVATR